MSDKEVSVGIIFTDGIEMLACQGYGHAFRKHNLDIPKGHWEEGETYKETAIRECEEETGYVIANDEDLIDLGMFEYLPTKDLYLYAYFVDGIPDLSTFHCDSYFELNGRKVPEVIKYHKIPLNELDYFYRNLERVLNEALEILADDVLDES